MRPDFDSTLSAGEAAGRVDAGQTRAVAVAEAKVAVMLAASAALERLRLPLRCPRLGD